MPEIRLKLNELACERDERVLFSKLTVDYGPGDIVQVAGVNGAGKTTLLRIICGLSSNFNGSIAWGEDSNRSYAFRSSLLYLGHAPGLNTSLTPMENLFWYFGLNGLKSSPAPALDKKAFTRQLKQALAETGMGGYEHVPCRMLSAGQQRRVALARIYCSAAPLWVLDEPFTAIDKDGVVALQKRFAEHAASGGLILLTSHQALELDNLQTLDLSAYRGAAP